MAEPSNNTPEASQFSESDFLSNLKDKIVEDGSKMEWINSIVQRNAISINALIAADIFGNLSDFRDDYPETSALVHIQILKAYLENKNNCTVDDIKYNVKNITSPLVGWLEHHESFDRTLDSAIVKEKMAKRVSWLVQLNANTKPIYNALFKLNVLNYMENALGESNLQDKRLEKWIQNSKQNLFKNSNLMRYEVVAPHSLFTGAYSFKRLLQNEIAELQRLAKKFKEMVIDISKVDSFSGILYSLISSLVFGLSFTIRMGKLALLPSRIAITAIRESASLCSKLLYRGMAAIMPNHTPSLLALKLLTLGVQITALISLASYFQVSMILLLGWQTFPESWSYGFIGPMSLGIAATELAAGIGLMAYNTVNSWLHSIINHNSAPQTEPDFMPTQASTISPTQRDKLIRLLTREKMAVTSNVALEQADKTEKFQQLDDEIRGLFNRSNPYVLSQYDKDLIKEKDVDGFDLDGSIAPDQTTDTDNNLRSNIAVL